MINNLKKIIGSCIPPNIKRFKLEYNLSRDYRLHKLDEYSDEINYIINHKAKFIPYLFTERYTGMERKSGYDTQKGLPFIIHNKKKLYFPRNMKLKKMIKIYNGLCTEQDKESPHKYFDEELEQVKLGESIFIDCGAAEGIISLDFIERVKKIFIIECSEKWISPLEATFEPWRDKVVILKKYVGNENSNISCRLDTLLEKETSNIIIKMDIEGYELAALEGAENLLTNKDLKVLLSVCTYHNKDDYEIISKKLEECGFSISPSKGFVLWSFTNILEYPYFRKCLVRAFK